MKLVILPCFYAILIAAVDLYFFRAPVLTALSFMGWAILVLLAVLRKQWFRTIPLLSFFLILVGAVFTLSRAIDNSVEIKANHFIREMRVACLRACPVGLEEFSHLGYSIRYFPSLGGRSPYVTYEQFGYKKVIVDIGSGKKVESASD